MSQLPEDHSSRLSKSYIEDVFGINDAHLGRVTTIGFFPTPETAIFYLEGRSPIRYHGDEVIVRKAATLLKELEYIYLNNICLKVDGSESPESIYNKVQEVIER